MVLPQVVLTRDVEFTHDVEFTCDAEFTRDVEFTRDGNVTFLQDEVVLTKLGNWQDSTCL